MNENNSPAYEASSLGTYWLCIRLDDRSWIFELGPDEDRAIVVGALLRAHVRVDRREIAPVHFHFEREGDTIRLVPGYRADLIVNGVAVSGMQSLDRQAVIEFSGCRMEVRVTAVRPAVGACDLASSAKDERDSGF